MVSDLAMMTISESATVMDFYRSRSRTCTVYIDRQHSIDSRLFLSAVAGMQGKGGLGSESLIVTHFQSEGKIRGGRGRWRSDMMVEIRGETSIS